MRCDNVVIMACQIDHRTHSTLVLRPRLPKSSLNVSASNIENWEMGPGPVNLEWVTLHDLPSLPGGSSSVCSHVSCSPHCASVSSSCCSARLCASAPPPLGCGTAYHALPSMCATHEADHGQLFHHYCQLALSVEWYSVLLSVLRVRTWEDGRNEWLPSIKEREEWMDKKERLACEWFSLHSN